MSTAPRYHVIDDFLPIRPSSDRERAAVDYVSYSPKCLIVVFPLAFPASADRAKLGTNLQGKSASVSASPADGVRLRADPLLITDDILSATFQGSKGSYAEQLQVSLCKSPINYLSALLPGDWVMCWMVQSQERLDDLKKRVKRLEPCNNFRDGLKFMGRVEGVSRDQNSTAVGLNRVSYSMQAIGFGELGSQVFYDPYLAEATPLMGSWLARIGGAISEMLGTPVDQTAKDGPLDVNRLIPFFLNLLMGQGVSQRFVNPSGNETLLQIATGLTKRDSFEAPYAYTVPGPVGQVLGRNPSSISADGPTQRDVLAYADLLELLTGVQRFTQSAGAIASSSAPWTIFAPDGVEPPPTGEVALRKATSTKLLGEFIPTIPDFTNKDVWTILRQWLNPVINEMYTAMRSNEFGQVVPTIVVRQIPLSSQVFADRIRDQEGVIVTPMLEVPRWVGHPAIVRQDSLARSNALRFNFIHVYGQSPIAQSSLQMTGQIIRNPPIRNDLDIQRSGLRSYMASVACSEKESRFGAKTWMAVAADWLLDQHLTLSGSVDMELVEAPIVVGDMFEYDGIVAQIEAVTHHFEVSGGQCRAMTRLTLTHGVRSDDDPIYGERDGTDANLFSGLRKEDGAGYDPGVFAEEERAELIYRSGPYEPAPSGE